MRKKISYLIYKILTYLNNIFKFITKRSFLIFFKDFIENELPKNEFFGDEVKNKLI